MADEKPPTDPAGIKAFGDRVRQEVVKNGPHGYHVFDAHGNHIDRTQDKVIAMARARAVPGASVFPVHDAMAYYGQTNKPSAWSEHTYGRLFGKGPSPIHVTPRSPRET